MQRLRGNAVVEVRDQLCLGCRTMLPPQNYVEVMRNDEIRSCPHCNRILHYKRLEAVVAPAEERSGSSHALTIRREVGYRRLRAGWYEVDGTPTDCVNIGLTRLSHGRVSLVASGINAGLNLGDDVSYSGTVAERQRYL